MLWAISKKRLHKKCLPKKRKKEKLLLRVWRSKAQLKDKPNPNNQPLKPRSKKSPRIKNKENKNKPAVKKATSNNPCPRAHSRVELTNWSIQFRTCHSTSLVEVCSRSTNWSWLLSWRSESWKETASWTQLKLSTWSSTRPTRTHPPCLSPLRLSSHKLSGPISRVWKAFPFSTDSVPAYNNSTWCGRSGTRKKESSKLANSPRTTSKSASSTSSCSTEPWDQTECHQPLTALSDKWWTSDMSNSRPSTSLRPLLSLIREFRSSLYSSPVLIPPPKLKELPPSITSPLPTRSSPTFPWVRVNKNLQRTRCSTPLKRDTGSCSKTST